MYRVLCIGDPHFKETTKEENDLLIGAVLQSAVAARPDHIVVMGDSLDRHKNAHLVPLRDATDFIYALSDIAQTHVLIGNHDMLNDQQYLSPYHPFPGIRPSNKRIVIVSQRCDWSFPGGDLVFLPYVPTGRLDEALGDIGDDVRMVFCHQMFRGATFKGISAPDGADYWAPHRPLAVSGHIHEYQRIGSNLIYVGTPRQSDFGDSINPLVPKGLSLFNIGYTSATDTRDKDSLTVAITEERIPLNLPGYQTHHVAADAIETWIPPVMPGGHPKDRHRVYVDGPDEEVRMFLSSSTCHDMQSNRGIRVYSGHITDAVPSDHDTWHVTDSYAYLNEIERVLRDNPRELAWHQKLAATNSTIDTL